MSAAPASARRTPRTRLFRGCAPEVAASHDGRILAVGEDAREAAGPDAVVHELSGRVLPGLADAHLHLEGLAARRRGVDLRGCRTLDEALSRIRRRARELPPDAWLLGHGWHSDDWADRSLPDRQALDSAAGGRPVFLARKDIHSAWVSTAALRAAGLEAEVPDPPGGVIDRRPDGAPTGILREKAVELVRRLVPPPGRDELDRSLLASLRTLASLGLTSVTSMDSVDCFSALQRLRSAGQLPLRVSYNLPLAAFPHAERMGVRSGWGDAWLRVWGVKAFLDGSLGSRTAQLLDGGGVEVLPQADLVDLAARCARTELNLCLHAIGDRAVRRALDALEPLAGAWALWRPRIEHAQLVDPSDQPRFRQAGVIASMQPIHAVTDREVADREWGSRTGNAYAWRALQRAGAVLAFGSDAPVEDADPFRGIEAATGWRRLAGWHPELAVSRQSALRAYTLGAAFAVGLERELGRVAPGRLCDLTVVEDGRAAATVVGGQLVWRRTAGTATRRPPGSRTPR